MEMATCIYNSPVGLLEIKATVDGVCSLSWTKEEASMEESEVYGCRDAKEHLLVCKDWLTAYFSGSLLKSPVPKPALVLPGHGTFSHSVWLALCKTEVGETVSYSELAGRAGNPSAACAVGQAMVKHSIPLLVPCHRVVRKGSQGLGNYSGGDGPATKQWLLEHEGEMAANHIH